VLGVRGDGAGPRQFEYLREFDHAAPVRVGEARVGRERVVAVLELAACDADHHYGAALRDHLRVQRERGVATDAVEHQGGATPVGELADLPRGVPARGDRVLGADGAG
jgi:hypothetical protein